MMGDEDSARRSYEDFLALWKDSEWSSVMPLLVAVRICQLTLSGVYTQNPVNE